jgi:hypothetical protein
MKRLPDGRFDSETAARREQIRNRYLDADADAEAEAEAETAGMVMLMTWHRNTCNMPVA